MKRIFMVILGIVFINSQDAMAQSKDGIFVPLRDNYSIEMLFYLSTRSHDDLKKYITSAVMDTWKTDSIYYHAPTKSRVIVYKCGQYKIEAMYERSNTTIASFITLTAPYDENHLNASRTYLNGMKLYHIKRDGEKDCSTEIWSSVTNPIRAVISVCYNSQGIPIESIYTISN